MVELMPLLQVSAMALKAGTLPPPEVLKALISKVGWLLTAQGPP